MSSNSSVQTTMSFDDFDLPMAAAAMRLASCTAMMCSSPRGKQVFNEQYKALKASIPLIATFFDEYHWSAIGQSLSTAKEWTCELRPRDGRIWTDDYHLYVTIDGKTWVGDDYQAPNRGVLGSDSPRLEELKSYLLQRAPLDTYRQTESAGRTAYTP